MATNKPKPYPAGALERLQQVELDILRVCAKLCDALEIDSWFMDSGTCLGAVRHGGFIPWDDDIDIGMKLADWRLFVQAAQELLPPEYGIYTHDATPNYPPLWAKVYKKGTRFMAPQMKDAQFEQGIYVDVFAYLQLDSNEAKAAKQVKHALFWQRVSYLYYTGHPKIRGNVPAKALLQAACAGAHKVARAAFTPAGIQAHFWEIEHMGNAQGKWVDIFYPNDGIFATQDLFPTKRIAFGSDLFPAPANPDAYLTGLYGNYRELPPEGERRLTTTAVLDFGDGVNVMEQG